jgi:hypothetical protein
MANGPDQVDKRVHVEFYLHLFIRKFIDRMVYEGLREVCSRDDVEEGVGRGPGSR